MEKFNDYWQGKPGLDKINLKVIDQTQIVKAMKNGEIDMTDSTTGSIAQEAKNQEMENLNIVNSRHRLCSNRICIS